MTDDIRFSDEITKHLENEDVGFGGIIAGEPVSDFRGVMLFRRHMPESIEPVRLAAIICARALRMAGFELGIMMGMTGEEEVIEGDAVQYWVPGEHDIDGNTVDHFAAQMHVMRGSEIFTIHLNL